MIILKEKLSKLMGQKSLKEHGLGVLGIKVKRKADEAFKSFFVAKKF